MGGVDTETGGSREGPVDDVGRTGGIPSSVDVTNPADRRDPGVGHREGHREGDRRSHQGPGPGPGGVRDVVGQPS